MQTSRGHAIVSARKRYNWRRETNYSKSKRGSKVIILIIKARDYINNLCFRKEGCQKCEFKVNEVYALDVLVSSGDGKVSNLNNFN